MNSNGTYNAYELNYEIVDTIESADIVVLEEDIKAWDSKTLRYYTVERGQNFVVSDGVAYPFDTPLYEADEDEGIEEQVMPGSWEDVIGIMEGFGA